MAKVSGATGGKYDPRLDPKSSLYDAKYAAQVAAFTPGGRVAFPTAARPTTAALPPTFAPISIETARKAVAGRQPPDTPLPGRQAVPGEPFKVPGFQEAEIDPGVAAQIADTQAAIDQFLDPAAFITPEYVGTAPRSIPEFASFEESQVGAISAWDISQAPEGFFSPEQISQAPEGLFSPEVVAAAEVELAASVIEEPFDQDAWLLNFANQRGFATWEEYEAWMKAYNAGEVPGYWEDGPVGYVDPFEEGGSGGGTGYGYSPPPGYGGGGRRGGGRGSGKTSKLIQTIRYLIPGA